MAPLVWLVTGCTSGIGEEIVKAALARGDHAIATARGSVDRLQTLKDAGATTRSLDVTADQAEIDKVLQEAIKVHGHIDVVVPNAGYLECTFIENATAKNWQDQFDVNFFGVTKVVGGLLPHFRERRSGTIAFSGSVYEVSTMHMTGLYAVSKAAVAAYAKTIALEMGSFNIKPIMFALGYYRTPVMQKAKLAFPSQDDYKSITDSLGGMLATMSDDMPGDPVKCAERIVDTVYDTERKSIFVPLGSDGLETVRTYAKALLAACDENEEKARSTDLDEPKRGFFKQFPQYFLLT